MSTMARISCPALERFALLAGLLLTGLLPPLVSPVTAAQVISGSYVGNGLPRSIAVAFQPDVVIIKRDDCVAGPTCFWGMVRTSTMVGDMTKSVADFPAVATSANGITALVPTGFTLGTDPNVNGAGGTFYWVAFRAAAGELAVGTYTGDGVAGRLIASVGFQPNAVMTFPEAAFRPLIRSSTMGADDCYNFDANEFNPGNRIQAFLATGFQVGSDVDVNGGGQTYHYIAWKAVAGKMAVGSYAGDGVDNRNLDVAGFQPEWVMVKRASNVAIARPWMHKPASTGLAADYGLFLADFMGTGNGIQTLRPLGFQVGTGPWVNTGGLTYHWMAFGNIPTAVELMSFEARAADGSVELTWQTGSELKNLGFQLYRSLSAQGTYDRITSTVIPGLGSSPVGASYSYVDRGLANGVTYFYELEDIETTGKTELHGPVWAAPQASASAGSGTGSGSPGSGGAGSSGGGSTTRIAYGDPSSVALRILERSERHALLELLTGGFYAVRQANGSVLLEIPGMEEVLDPGLPSLPVKRAFVDAVVGRGARLGAVVSHDVLTFAGLVPELSGSPEMAVNGKGVVRARVRRAKVARLLRPGLFPVSAARLAGTAFQGELKKALVELWPLRWDSSSNRLELARRLVVRLEFAGKEEGESARGALSRGRRFPAQRLPSAGQPLAQLMVRQRGVYAVSFEELFPSRRHSLAVSELRLSRQGDPVAFHMEPAGSSFGPGSVLYFFTEGASLNPYENAAVYELSLDRSRSGGVMMPIVSASPSGSTASFAWTFKRWEENRSFQPGLLEAPDLWLWDTLVAPVKKSYSFALESLAPISEPSQLTVFLQGGSDQDGVDDHHVRVWVNGTAVAEATWDGQTPRAVLATIGPGILRDADNLLELESLGDAGANYSLVFLDRFELSHPRSLSAPDGLFEARFSLSGSAEVSGLGAGSLLLDVTSPTVPRWLFGASPTPGGIAFRAEDGLQYLALSPQRMLHPELRFPIPSSLRSARNRADYLLLAPQAFLPAAQPLLDLRAQQGLVVKAIALEEVYQDFGHGEATPQAIRDFIAYAYHFWQSPSPRYVLLLGDASYDYKDYLHSGTSNRVPPLLVKTSFLWTASDPAYAAVNGEDLLPDLALGRLPASSLEEARTLVEKIVAFESSGQTLTQGPAVLVADNPDVGGDFESSALEVAPLLAPTHTVETIFLRELGGATRPAIAAALDRGAALVSYLGHGGIAVWASENIFNNQDVATLAPQAQQPVLLTIDCLNGYFHFPFLNSLAEELLKAPDRGSIASFSPSGLSLHDPADLFHRALIQEITSGHHERLGDAVFAAQADFAQTGVFPELLSIYNLLGDPALKIR